MVKLSEIVGRVDITMKPSSIRYYFKEGIGSLIKNRLMTIASMATVSACIFIMACSYCMVNNLQYILDQMEDTIGVAVFLKGDLPAEQIETLKKDMEKIKHVSNVQYISPDDALDDLKEEWDLEEGILEGFSGENNPLSNSFKISLDGIEYQADVLKQLQQMKGIDTIRHAQTETEILMKVNRIIQIGGIAVILILGIVSIFIIMNTIKISVYSRRNEINIMKYVGATDWFIRWPFVIEGVLIGLIGSIIPMLVVWPLYGKSINVIYEFLPMIKNLATFRLPSEIFATLLPISLAFGVLLGVIGSVTSMRKHLKV